MEVLLLAAGVVAVALLAALLASRSAGAPTPEAGDPSAPGAAPSPGGPAAPTPAAPVRAAPARPAPARPAPPRRSPDGPRVEEHRLGGVVHLRALRIGPPDVVLTRDDGDPAAPRDPPLGDPAFDAVTRVTTEDPRQLALLDPGFRARWTAAPEPACLEHGAVRLQVDAGRWDALEAARDWLAELVAHRVAHPLPTDVDAALRAACAEDPAPGVRAALLEVLAAEDLAAATAVAARWASSEEPAERRAAERIAAWPRTLASLLGEAPRTDDAVRRIVRQLVRLADPGATAAALRTLAGHTSARPWEEVLASLRAAPPPVVAAALAAGAPSGTPRHRRSLARALRRWSPPDEGVALALLAAPELEVALAAAAVLGEAGTAAALEPLRASGEAGPPALRTAAAEAARAIRARVGDLVGSVALAAPAPLDGAVSDVVGPERGGLRERDGDG